MTTFYDDIAEAYDDMTAASGREQGAAALAARLIERFAIHSALDAACGTGLHAVALARAGVRVVGSDISEAMLRQARGRAAAAGVEVQWVAAPMQALAGRVEGPFDAVLCLGNSLPHLQTDEDLAATFRGFAGLLHPGGVAVLHVLNYERLLAAGDRIVHISRHGDVEYVRFYDVLEDRLRFNILKIAWEGDRCRHSLRSTDHRPHTVAALTAALTTAGLANIRLHRNLQFEPFDPGSSQAVVITAGKPMNSAG